MGKKTFWLVVYLIARASNAEIYDPFYLASDRDYVKRLAWLNYNGEPLFYFDTAIEAQIEEVVRQAQKLKVHLAIDFKKMAEGNISIKYGQPKKNYFLLEKQWQKAFKVLKEHKIEFEWALIDASDIYKTCAPLTYAFRYKTGIYWLTEKQEYQLLSLKVEGVKLKINLTAINARKPYRNLIPAHEVILMADDLVK